MKIMVVGASGTIGKAVADALSARHEVVRASRKGDVLIDLTDSASIASAFRTAANLDAVVCTAGAARWKPLGELSEEDYLFSLTNKLLGQVNLVRLGMKHLREGGSFTLTSGVLAHEPTPGSAAVTTVNAALEAFARAAALELPRGLRVNVVSPPWVAETLQAMGKDPSGGMPAAEVAKAYVEAVEGRRSGETIDARKLR